MSSNRSGSTSSTRRRGASRLLSAGGKLSVVGLVASVLTIAFVLWIQASMRRQIDVAEPLARSTLDLRGALSSSFAHLRGWVAYGDEDAKRKRLAVWAGEIAPSLATMNRAVLGGGAELDAAEVRELEEHLRQLKYLQWTIEDTARTPANVPARALYVDELRPIRAVISRYLLGFPLDPALNRLRALVAETDQSLTLLLDDFSPALAVSTRRLAERTRGELGDTLASVPAADRSPFAREVGAFINRVERVVTLRSQPDWNQASARYGQVVRPIQEKAETLIKAISERQYRDVKKRSRELFRWSFLILALALLVGVLSIASLYVSYRLEDRVANALAKAKNVGQYVIEGRIGGGGMGQVYRAKHALLRRPSAIKVLRSDALRDVDAQARFQDEVRITSSLSHPNTIAIYDYGKTPEGFFYYAMELLQGVNLEALVRISGRLPEARVVHILKQMCGSLVEAHQRGLLHRDIKPSNIMVAEVGGIFDVVKVFDFGLVQRAGSEAHGTDGSSIVGTPAYLAPETIESKDNASPRSEVYAIGAVAYFLVCGTRVFNYQKVAEMLEAHLHESVVLPSQRLGASMNKSLEAIVFGCLAKDPSERPQSVADLLELLEKVDVEVWSTRDARRWWEDYGEAIIAEANARALGSADGTAPSAIGPASRT